MCSGEREIFSSALLRVLSYVILGVKDGNPLPINHTWTSVDEILLFLLNTDDFEQNVVGALVFGNKNDNSRFMGEPDLEMVIEFAKSISDDTYSANDILEYLSWPDLYYRVLSHPRIGSILKADKWNSILKVFQASSYNWNRCFPSSSKIVKGEDPADLQDSDMVARSGLFDPVWYLNKYHDVALSGMKPLVHYMKYGAFERRDPCELFDANRYTAENPDVGETNVNPLVHWIKYGRIEGRRPPFRQSIGDDTRDADWHPSVMEEVEEIIRISGCFSEAYYTAAYPDVAESEIDPLHHYVRYGWRENRNPSAEFDTWFYNKSYPQHAVGPAGGFLHYVRNGQSLGLCCRPKGSITVNADTVFSSNALSRVNSHRIAIHVHLYYIDTVEDFCRALKNIPFDFDLYISLSFEEDAYFVEKVIEKNLTARNTKIFVIENRGRDIGPFCSFLQDYSQSYEFVCHLHSKKSKHASFGEPWRHWILDSMFGSRNLIMSYVNYLLSNPLVGTIYPDNYFEVKQYMEKDRNDVYFDALCERLSISKFDLTNVRTFAAGSMIWLRVSAVKSLISAKLDLEEFEKENNQIDFTLAHVLERAIHPIVEKSGFINVVYYVNRRQGLIYQRNYVEETYRDILTRKWEKNNVDVSVDAPLPLDPLTRLFNGKKIDIHWIISDFKKDMSEHANIFRMIGQLTVLGNRQTVWIQNCVNHQDPPAAKKCIQIGHRSFPDEVVVRFLPEDVRSLSGDAVIATDLWATFPARRCQNFKARFYLIQDFEPLFYPMGETYLLAKATYASDLMALCMGEWLYKTCIEHGMWARCWFPVPDFEYYFRNENTKGASRVPKVAFYCQSSVPGRAASLGFSAFRELRRRETQFELVIFGEEPRERQVLGPLIDRGALSPNQMGELYRECDIGVVFSTTNYSIVPLEMMACGLPVVEIDRECSRGAFPDKTVTLAAPNPVDIAESIERLLKNDEVRKSQQESAYDFISKFNFSDSAKLINGFIYDGLIENGCEDFDPGRLCSNVVVNPHRVSVVVPSCNGGDLLRRVIEAVANQNCDFKYDVLVVDSESSDGTAEFIKSYGRMVRYQEIDKQDFQHGRTRNLAVSLTSGEIVAMITQDALPCNEHWLSGLVSGFDVSDRVAGVTGRHIAYPHHNRYVARDLDRMFEKFDDFSNVYSLDRRLPSFVYPGGSEDQAIKRYFSNNNSAIRRSIWEKVPYPEIDWGEDQVWCWEILKVGFEKAYIHEAAVYHSHTISTMKDSEIALKEGFLFGKYFGIAMGHDVDDGYEVPSSMIFSMRSYALKHGIKMREFDEYLEKFLISSKFRLKGYARSKDE